MSEGKQKAIPPNAERQKERGISMAEKKMTRKEALEFAINDIAANSMYDEENTDASEAIKVLSKMLEQVSKPRKKSDAPSKARLQNEILAGKVVEAMDGHDAVSGKWIIEHVSGIMTPQKCTAVMKILIDASKAVKNKEGKTVTYSLV